MKVSKKDRVYKLVNDLIVGNTTPRMLLVRFFPLCVNDEGRSVIREAIAEYGNN